MLGSFLLKGKSFKHKVKGFKHGGHGEHEGRPRMGWDMARLGGPAPRVSH